MANKPDRRGQGQECYDQLRRLLIHMQVRPGARLVESEWAARLKVHRTALREAMSLLAHEGLLARGERGGYFTPSLDQADLDDIWAVRAIVEAGAIRLLAHLAHDDVDLAPLDAAIDAMEQMLHGGYEIGHLEADRRFHQALVELGGNARLCQLYDHAPLPLMPSPSPDAAHRRAVGEETIRQHRAIARLLHERRFEEAVERLEEHLHQAHRPSPIY